MPQKANINMEESLYGLLGCVSDLPNLRDALDVLELVELSSTAMTDEKTPIERQFIQTCLSVAQSLCSTATDTTLHKKQTWQALQQTAQHMQQDPTTEANALAVSFVFGALSLLNHNETGAKAAASAMSSTISRNKGFRHQDSSRTVAKNVLKTFLVHSSCSDALNLNILTHFAKAFKISQDQDSQYSELASSAIRFSLQGILLEDNSETTPTTVTVPMETDSFLPNEATYEVKKQKVSAALSFACQVGPWPVLSPVLLIDAAIPYDFWHASELVCISAHKAITSSNSMHPQHQNNDHDDDCNVTVSKRRRCLLEATQAVETLVDAAMEARLFRLADNMATKLYHEGGNTRYVEARLYHALETISKVIYKRQLPIIERQTDRVEKAVEKVQNDWKMEGQTEKLQDGTLSAVSEVRNFALQRLSEAGEIAAAHRLANIWSMEYIYDEKTMLEAATARRKRYIQWDECLPGAVPDVISDPQSLRKVFERIQNDGIFGIDAEWDEDTIGAELVQFSGTKEVLLLDIPALSFTEEGVMALSETVGAILDSAESVVVGFAPRQDLSRLRASPCATDGHWLSGSRAVVDSQRLVGEVEPKLKTLGLSRVCQHYLGKPLDKAEQCSMWSARPLSDNQRAYAAMDAWACIAIYEKLHPRRTSR